MQGKAVVVKMERKHLALSKTSAEVPVKEYVSENEDMPAFKLRAGVLLRGT